MLKGTLLYRGLRIYSEIVFGNICDCADKRSIDWIALTASATDDIV